MCLYYRNDGPEIHLQERWFEMHEEEVVLAISGMDRRSSLRNQMF
jgi:hypothetical protein